MTFVLDMDYKSCLIVFYKDDSKQSKELIKTAYSLSNQYDLDVTSYDVSKHTGINTIEQLYDIQSFPTVVLVDTYNGVVSSEVRASKTGSFDEVDLIHMLDTANPYSRFY